MRILLCDDVPEYCKEAAAAIKAGAPKQVQCRSLCGNELQEKLKEFFGKVRSVLDGGSMSAPSKFDGYDIIIIDNNLSALDFSGARLTAESIVGYIRAFSTSLYVISLNKNPNVDFDLKYLVGDYATRADLALNTQHLRNKGLWIGEAADARERFRPWYWPRLKDVAARRRQQIDFVQRRLDKPILSSFNFPKGAVEVLSRHAAGALSPSASLYSGDVERVTFRDVFSAWGRSLPAEDDRDNLIKKGAGGIIARVVAADLDFWFRREYHRTTEHIGGYGASSVPSAFASGTPRFRSRCLATNGGNYRRTPWVQSSSLSTAY
jgi:hypothetical protein